MRFSGSVIILRYHTGQQVALKNKRYHHMLDTCFGDQWLVEYDFIVGWLAEAWVELNA